MKARDRILNLLMLSKLPLTASTIQNITNVWFPYIHLAYLERSDLIVSKWVEGPYPRIRVYYIP